MPFKFPDPVTDLFQKLDVDLSHVVTCHVDRRKDVQHHRDLPQSGVSVEYDSAFRWKDGEVNWTYRLLDELECHITTLNPGETSHAPHKHPEEEVIIIKEGTLASFANGITKKIGPGSVIFLVSQEMHGIRNVGDTPATYHVFSWRSPGMSEKGGKK